MNRTITIVITDTNNFDIHEGELFCHRLTWDEMLGQVAMLTMPDSLIGRRHLFRMKSPDELLADNERRAERMSRIQPHHSPEGATQP